MIIIWYVSEYKKWCYKIWKIFSLTGFDDLFYNRMPCDIDIIRDKLFDKQKEKWKAALVKKTKLRFY